MRFAFTMVCLASIGTLAGCETFRWGLFRRDPQQPSLPGNLPTTESLVAYLNDNASRVRSLRSTDVDITATQRFQSFGLRGKMMTMKPRSFLMTASAFSNPMVDLGSNDSEFWFWFSKADPPYQFYCNYKDYEEGRVARLPVPFQPEWIMESLGMGPYGPASKYTLEHDATTLRLVEKTRSPQGNAVRKVIVMNRRPVQPPNPQVQAHLLVDDATNKEICAAYIQDVQIDSVTGALVPRRLELRWPAENAKLSMTLNGLNVNPQLDAASFQRQPLQGVQSFDLARAPSGGGLQRTQATAP